MVVGGGIVGLCTALAAAERQLHVAVVDDAQLGAASRASAGMLAPSLDGLSAAVRAIAIAARDMYPGFLARLLDSSGVDVPLNRGGILELAASEADLRTLLARAGSEARGLTANELARLEPALAGHSGAVHHLLDGAVDNVSLMDALWIAAERHPRIDVFRYRVASIDLAGKRACATLSNGNRIESDSIVVATGAWARLPGAPHPIPVRPVKGELLTLDRVPITHVVYAEAGYLVPRGQTLLVGATSEDAGFDPAATGAGRKHLRHAVSALIPTLASALVVEHWAGLRPVSPDGLPILGRDHELPALVYACGFSRNGILLGPWAGDALGAVIATEAVKPLPREFDPRRFGN